MRASSTLLRVSRGRVEVKICFLKDESCGLTQHIENYVIVVSIGFSRRVGAVGCTDGALLAGQINILLIADAPEGSDSAWQSTKAVKFTILFLAIYPLAHHP